MITRNHYFLFIERLNPSLAIVKGNHSETPDRWCVVINMKTRAVMMETNIDVRGAVILPGSATNQVWYLVNDATKGVVCNADSLFDREALDTVTCKGAVMGPNFYVETKKFNAGDALRLKRYKLLLLHYLVQGTNLKVDTVLGLNDIGQTLSYQFPASNFTWSTLGAQFQSWTALGQQYATWSSIVDSVFLPKRTRFLKKSQHFALRIYPVTRATRLRLGPFQIGFKEMRPGRAS
jgi:hypothetical protein